MSIDLKKLLVYSFSFFFNIWVYCFIIAPPVRPKPGTKPRKKPVPTPAIRPGAKSKKAKDCFDFSLDKEANSPTDKEAPDPGYFIFFFSLRCYEYVV